MKVNVFDKNFLLIREEELLKHKKKQRVEQREDYICWIMPKMAIMAGLSQTPGRSQELLGLPHGYLGPRT